MTPFNETEPKNNTKQVNKVLICEMLLKQDQRNYKTSVNKALTAKVLLMKQNQRK